MNFEHPDDDIPGGAARKVVNRMRAALTHAGVPRDRIDRIIEAAYQGAREHDESTLSHDNLIRTRRVLVELLQALGVNPTGAIATAQVIGLRDITALTAPPTVAADTLDVNFATLKIHRDKGSFVPWIQHETASGIARPLLYGLHYLLYAVAWRDLHPHTGGYGERYMPERW